MYLMNSDRIVLEFSFEDMYINVVDNKFLPYSLKDYVKTSSMDNGLKKSLKDIELLKEFLTSRIILLSRENVKAILNVANLPQTLKMDDRLKIVFACKGLSLIDNFWIKNEDDNDIFFSDVNLRNNKLSNASYEIAILGKYISATAEELRSDLSTTGMFPKFWRRKEDGVYLYKTDKLINNWNSVYEVNASKGLKEIGLDVVDYFNEKIEDKTFSVSKCISTDDVSLMSASELRDWCRHKEIDFIKYIEANWITEFSNMIVSDYLVANVDRHIENWGFLIDNENNNVLKFAPLYDFNQALIADNFGTDIDDLIYEPTGLSFKESVEKYVRYCDLRFNDFKILNKNMINRFNFLMDFVNNKEIEHVL